jgi:5-methylcytosine-specific restriction endonuclease McrA
MAEKLSARSWEELGYEAKRRQVIREQSDCCNHCGLSEWRGKPIALEIEHKNGIHADNARENLEAICPNCHSQTDTWRGRNKSVRLTDEQIIEALLSNKNIRQALLSLGVAAKGGNYKRASLLKSKLV